MTDLSALEKFAGEVEAEVEEETGPQPFKSLDPSRQILAFDQSIANTGYALVYGNQVVMTGNIKTEPTGEKQQEDLLRRGVEIYGAVKTIVLDAHPTHIVHETPPQGGRLVRPEASLVASLGIRLVADMLNIPVTMIQAQKAKKRWTGNGNAKKKAMKDAMLRLHPWLKNIKPMNEAIIDALAIGFLAGEMTNVEVGW